MKKFLSATLVFALVLLLVFSFAGCKKQKVTNSEQASGQGLAPALLVKIGDKSIYTVAHETSWNKKGYTYKKTPLEEAVALNKSAKVGKGKKITVEFKGDAPDLVTIKAHLVKVGNKNVSDKKIEELVPADFISGKAEIVVSDTLNDFIDGDEELKKLAKDGIVRGFTLECKFGDTDKCEYAFIVK